MILIAGATGSLGGRIVNGLLESGDTVRALVRPQTDARSLIEAGVEVITGDLRDPASLYPACRGADAVISTASTSRRGDDSPENVDDRGNRNLVRAAFDAGVRHFTLVSAMGASSESPVAIFRAKGMAEQHVRESGVNFTILQPNPFMDVWFGMLIEAPVANGQPVTLVGESRRRHAFVCERDVAAFAIASIRKASARNATIAIGGPEAVTFRDVVAAYEAAAGRAIPVVRVAPGDPIPGLPEPVWGIAAALETYDSLIPMEATARNFGVTLTSVQAFAARSPLAALSH